MIVLLFRLVDILMKILSTPFGIVEAICRVVVSIILWDLDMLDSKNWLLVSIWRTHKFEKTMKKMRRNKRNKKRQVYHQHRYF